jgi:hypothetical protein
MTPSAVIRVSLAVALLQFSPFTQASRQQGVMSQETSPVLAEPLKALVAQFARSAEKLGCNHGSCKTLIADFVLPDGHTSPFGIQSETLSALLSKGEKTFIVIDRSKVQDFLQPDRIPARFVNQPGVACWLGRKFNADVVVTGESAEKRNKQVELSTHWLSVKDEKQSLHVSARFPEDAVDISSVDTLRPLPPLESTFNRL